MKTPGKVTISAVLFAAIGLPTIAIAGDGQRPAPPPSNSGGSGATNGVPGQSSARGFHSSQSPMDVYRLEGVFGIILNEINILILACVARYQIG